MGLGRHTSAGLGEDDKPIRLKEVGVFEDKRLIKTSTIKFVNGEVMLTCGKVDGSQLTWTQLFHDSRDMELVTLMCRPKNDKARQAATLISTPSL